MAVNRTLKANKAFESAKVNGLLVVALDGNAQFKSQHRCCPACCPRRLAIKDAAGQPQTVTEYYHRQVYAQLHGPDFRVILDVEPIWPGEDAAAAALRWLGRMRRLGWGAENQAFNELTQHDHLPHCPRHEATAIQNWLRILVLGFNLFALFARLHGKLWRQRHLTLQERARQLDHAWGDHGGSVACWRA